jgi:hypothetical protein
LLSDEPVLHGGPGQSSRVVFLLCRYAPKPLESILVVALRMLLMQRARRVFGPSPYGY